MSTQATNEQDNPFAGFGPNEWIVEEMYQQYLTDPGSVDPAWHEFFADYKPADEDAEEKPAPTAPSAISRWWSSTPPWARASSPGENACSPSRNTRCRSNEPTTRSSVAPSGRSTTGTAFL